MLQQQLFQFADPQEPSERLPDVVASHHKPTDRQIVYDTPERDEEVARSVKSVAALLGIKTRGVPHLVASILAARGYKLGAQIEEMIRPDLTPLPNPSLLKNFDMAVQALVLAIKNGDKIGINGDYDVDGTTAVAQAVKLLSQVGAPHEWTIPHRERDGYGLSDRIAQNFIDSGCRLVLLFDHGSHNIKEIQALRTAGIRVLVFDHHAVGPDLPDAIVVNPAQPGCGFSDYKPCASGLAFFLSQRVSELLHLPAPDCGLAALGTIADMVPLVGPNRTIAYQGLRALRGGSCRGVTHLSSQLSVSPGSLSSVDVGFYVGPAINAAGRLDDAGRCVELLTSTDEAALQKLASELVATNEHRKEIQRKQLGHNYDRLAALKVLPKVLVSSHSEHHQGVVGLTAQGLAQRHARPAFVFASGSDGTLKGSARAGAERYDLSKILADARALDTDGVIIKAGGHKAAAGLTIQAEGLTRFTKLISQAAGQQMPTPPVSVSIQADAKLTFKALTPQLISDTAALLDPFGQGFAQPKILFESVSVSEIFSYPGGRHMLVLEQDGRKVRAFVGPEVWDGTIRSGCVVNLIAVPAAVYKNDKRHVQLVTEGLSVVSQPEAVSPTLASQNVPPPTEQKRIESPPIRLPQIVRPVVVTNQVRRDPPKFVALRDAFIKVMRDLPRPFIYADLKDLVHDFSGSKLMLQREAARIELIGSHNLTALRPDSFSVRPEQLEFIRWFLERSDNAILQAPTGSGKTEMALVIASKQRSMGYRTIFCAPTIEIQRQVSERAPQMIDVEATLLDGAVSPKKRDKLYTDKNPAFICAVPHVVKNDIERGAFSFNPTDLLIIDEGHHTTGEYPYVPLIHKAREVGARVLLLSATPGQIGAERSWDKFESLKELVGVKHIFPINVVRQQASIRPVHLELPDDVKAAIGDLSKRMESLRTYTMEYLHENGSPSLIREAKSLLGSTTLAFPAANTLLPLIGRIRSMNEDKERWGVVNALCATIELAELYQLLAYQGISGFLLRVIDKRLEMTFPVEAVQTSSGKAFLSPKKALTYVYGSSDVERAYGRLAQGSFVGVWNTRSLEQLSGLTLANWRAKTTKERRTAFNKSKATTLNKLAEELAGLSYSDHPKEAHLIKALEQTPRREQSIVFVRDRAHALFLAARLSHYFEPYERSAVALTGSGQGTKQGLSRAERKRNLDELAAGRSQIVVSTSAGNEGIDFARVQRGFAYRFSGSPTEALQQWGRLGRRDGGGEMTYLCSAPEEHGKFLSVLRKVAEFYGMLNQERQDIIDTYGWRPK